MVQTGKQITICTDRIVGVFSERVFGDMRVQTLITEHGELVLRVTYQSKIAPEADTSALDRIQQSIKEQ